MKHTYWICIALVLCLTMLFTNTVQAAPQSLRSKVHPSGGDAALLQPGQLDLSFDPGSGANDFVFGLALQSNRQVLVGGQFTMVNGVAHAGIARMNANGTLDPAFTTAVTGAGFAGLTSIALQTDGYIIVGGAFTAINGTPRANVARLTGAGLVDASFDPGTGVTGTDAYLNTVKLQADGKVLIGGFFSGVGGTPRSSIARLTSTGSLDTTFNPGSGANNEVLAIDVQPEDGKVLIGGSFSAVNNLTHIGLARLDGNGSVDGTFNPILNGMVTAIAVQPNHKILIGGAFTLVNDVECNRIARLNPDGSLDTSFDTAGGADNEVDMFALQPDGKIVVGGKFTTLGGEDRIRIGRLNPNGSLDESFDPGDGATYTVYAAVLQPDGRILIGGGFSEVNGVSRNSVARLLGDPLRMYLPVITR